MWGPENDKGNNVGAAEKEKAKLHYAEKGGHGARHDSQGTVKEYRKNCDRDCSRCPMSKLCDAT